MLGPNGSGFGWSELDQCVLVEKHIFDDWVKFHPNAAGLRNKPFPHLVPLGQVFGKHRANGYGSEPPEKSTHVINQHDSPIKGDELEGDGLNDMQSSVPETQTPNGTLLGAGTVGQGRKKRVRANDGVVASLAEIGNRLGTIYKSSTKNIATIAAAFKIETDATARKMRVFEEMLHLMT